MPAGPDKRKIFDSPLFRRNYSEGDHPTANAALPDASLEFLLEFAREIEADTIFEFGSGRSTLAFLQAGFSVASLEHSSHWMEQTRKQLSEADKQRHFPLVRPLRRRFHGMIPVLDWSIDPELAQRIGEADLVLIDSPYFAPFRESTLWSALVNNSRGFVVLDDTRIPTLSRFCDRIAAMNPALLHRRVRVGHTFDIFARASGDTQLVRSHTAIEVLKGWRRFFIALADPASRG